jgi:hypothetical protein
MQLFKSLRDVDYIVDNRNLIESIFDLELKDPIVKGYFYTGTCRKLVKLEASNFKN